MTNAARITTQDLDGTNGYPFNAPRGMYVPRPPFRLERPQVIKHDPGSTRDITFCIESLAWVRTFDNPSQT